MTNKIVIALLLIYFAHNASGQTKTDLQWIQEVEKNKKAESNLILNAYTDEHTQLRHIYYFILHNGRKIVPEVNSIHIRLKDNNLVQHHNNYSLQSISKEKFPTIQANNFLQFYLRKNNLSTEKYIESKHREKSNFRIDYKNDKNVNDEISIEEVYFSIDEKISPAVSLSHHSPSIEKNIIYDAANFSILHESNRILDCEISMPQNHLTCRFKPSDVSQTQLANSYHVFSLPTESPNHNSRSFETEPWLKNTVASPLGWHNDGVNTYTITKGNNVDCYEDMDANDAPRSGDSSYALGGALLDFDFPYSIDSNSTYNRPASTTNVFYWNNIVHDIFYNYGFTEAASNFQHSNFGRGGIGGDVVKAEIYDEINEARNNANFGTPPDGISARMQVYAWQAPSFDTMIVHSPSAIAGKYSFVPAAIGPKIKAPISASLAFPVDGSAYPTGGCTSYTSSVRGKIAVVDRGICSITNKVFRAQDSGAVAIIICNHEQYNPFVIGGYISSSAIPVVMMSKANCAKIRLAAASTIQVTILPASEKIFSIGNKNYIFSQANFGPDIPRQLTKANVQVIDNLGNIQDACDPIQNDITNKIAFIDEGNCEISYKIYQAQIKGASAAVICHVSNDYPDTLPRGNFGNLITIPSIGLSKSDCDEIKSNLPSNSTFINRIPQLLNGEMDAGLITHEYGHGVSLRLTGGGAGSCLSNQEQAGEGWSDFFGLALTQKSNDDPYLNRGIGSFVSGQQIREVGIRPYPYHVDTSINPARYGWLLDPLKISQPHGIGYVWCSMLWDLNWALRESNGFEPDFYNNTSTAGNIIALHLVVQGLKLQTCNPGFVDARNAILMADTLMYNGANSCRIWNIFARRGLGWSANQGSPYRRDDGVEAYDLPPLCTRMSEFELFGQRVLSIDELALFAEAEKNTISIHWNIAESLQQYPYIIYKKSFSQKEQTVLVEKNTSSNNHFIDNAVEHNETYYYQLSIVREHDVLNSPWVYARIKDVNSSWTISPNPSNGNTKIQLKEKVQDGAVLRLYNAIGLKLDEYEIGPNTNEILLTTENLPSGNYYIHFTNGIKVSSKKLVLLGE